MERRRPAARSGWCACAAALLVVLAGCGEKGGEVPSSTPVTSTSLTSPPDPGCTEDLPHALTFTPETATEADLNRYLSGCSDEASTRLSISGDSPVPWVLDRPTRQWTTPSPNPEIQILRAALEGQAGLVIAPGEQVKFDLPPKDLHLTLTPGSAAAWSALRKVSSQVQERAKDRLVETLAEGRPARRAALTCAMAGAEFGYGLGSEAGDGQSATDRLNTVLELAGSGVSSAQTCGGAIQKAERELAGSTTNRRALVTLEQARIAALQEPPRFTNAFGAAIRRGASIAVRLLG